MSRWKGPRKRYGGPWYGNDSRCAFFEHGVKQQFPTLRGITRKSGSKAGRTYKALLDVPHYEQRQVEIFFSKQTPSLAKITADGPTDSPHRYSERELCIWYPGDLDSEKWVVEDGLLMLLGLIIAHLFREAWWRETGEWLGPEKGHP